MPLYRRIDNVYSLDPLSTQTKSTFHPLHRYASPTPPNKDYGNYNVYGSFTNHPKGRHMSVQSHPEGRGIATYIGLRVNLYWSASRPILVRSSTYIGSPADPYRFEAPPHRRLSPRVLYSIWSAKASDAQLSDIPLRSGTQALRLIASIPLIQRKEKHRSREGKSTFT